MLLLIAYSLFLLDNVIREILRGKKKAKRFKSGDDDRHSSLLTISFLFLVPLSPLLNSIDLGTFNSAFIQWSGIVIQIVGIIIRIIALQTLGAFYTGTLQIVSNHQLIKTGIYKIIRHPGYFSVLLSSLGFGMAVGNWIALLIILTAFFFVYTYRIITEEKMLLKTFGSEYIKYRKSTKRLIPFIY